MKRTDLHFKVLFYVTISLKERNPIIISSLVQKFYYVEALVSIFYLTLVQIINLLFKLFGDILKQIKHFA